MTVHMENVGFLIFWEFCLNFTQTVVFTTVYNSEYVSENSIIYPSSILHFSKSNYYQYFTM